MKTTGKEKVMQEMYMRFEMINHNILAGTIGTLMSVLNDANMPVELADEMQKLWDMEKLRNEISTGLKRKLLQALKDNSGAN